ncbi:MAG: hypothetical protein IKN42_05755, partial [Elusimicrobia bacterium]|nr:hypothetical protein [Elusimicrobiota bacterium]
TNAAITNEAGKTITATTITNEGTVENAGAVTVTNLSNSGTITNEGTITSENAIANSGTMTSNAEKIVITGTSKEITNTGTYNVTGGTISYKVSGANGTVNVRDSEVTLDNSIEGNTITLGTTLKVKDDSYLDSSATLVIENGALLITDNGAASEIGATVNIAEGAEWKYQLDVDLEDITKEDDKDYGKADKLNVGTVGANSEATISGIHINKDKMTKTTVAIATKDIKAYIAGNINIYTTNLKYKVTSRVENGETVLDIEADGYGGLAAAVYDGAGSYSITEYVDYLTAWIEEGGVKHDTLKANLDIEGNNQILTSTTNASGIKTSTYTLTVDNVKEYSGFENAITVQKIGEEAGSLKVSTVTFTGNTGEAVITNEGTTELSNVTFSSNSATVDVANAGELKISGSGKTTTIEKGISGTGKTNIEAGATLSNGASSTISQSSITIAGTLTNKNESANAIEATEELAIANGGTLKTNAGAVKADNGISNEGLVMFTGGENKNAITGVDGEIIIDGEVINSANVAQKKVIITTGKLTTNASVVSATNGIENAGVVEFTGGTNANKITGSGNLTVTGDLTNNANIEQSSVTIASGVTENSETSRIKTSGEGIGIANGAKLITHGELDTHSSGTGKIANEGILEISLSGDAQNSNIIDGSGTLLISNGRFDNMYEAEIGSGTINQGNIVVNSGAALTSSATAITTTNGIANEGTVVFYDGKNTNKITGDNGELNIEGIVENEGKVEQSKVKVGSDKKLTTSADNVVTTNGIVNAGTVTFTSGKNVNEITGESGRIEIAGEVENDNNITQKEVEVQSGELA